ncbi:MAG TPA: proline dehydrogenase family protein, partial [bacterium]|nr:proline dehydrogenase family protein [bacterium]
YSQISALAAENTINVLCDRLELLYRTAMANDFIREDGSRGRKLVYLDMEEYHDMQLTAEAFMRTLDRPGLDKAVGGIALQAYLPDSFIMMKRIMEWANRRAGSGGTPVTIRLVKGANLEMEKIDASAQCMPQTPYIDKIDVDANYKRMFLEGIKPENAEGVRLGVASHNVFDIAFCMVHALESGAIDRIQFEMLEGMVDSLLKTVRELTDRLLVYAPATSKKDFISAIGYLIRRMDENTGPDNFLSHSFGLEVGNSEWIKLKEAFLESCRRMDGIETDPRRCQDRHETPEFVEEKHPVVDNFQNESNTDFALIANQKWAEEIIGKWEPMSDDNAPSIPLVIDGKEITKSRVKRVCSDPSRPGVVAGRYLQANGKDIERAVRCAVKDEDGWRGKSYDETAGILRRVAQEVRAARADLMGAAMADGGKTFPESDPEVSEAIDFLEFYPRGVNEFADRPNLECRGKGVVAVVPPWNFPIAIPCGGIAAALAAGNTVIMKPASDAVLTAYELCKCFWRGGVSKKTLQFAPCPGGAAGSKLVCNPDVDVVILTGGTSTALRMLEARPDMNLLAETGGKNATIVTATADREQAIKHILHSAFSHAGQKCSATSLLILEEEVYEDEQFRRRLKDAVESMPTGPAWNLENRVGPVIRPPDGDLLTGMTELEPGEFWLVPPRQLDDNPCMWAPAVKWNVKPGAFTHMTELFGPVLSVMKARDLDEAISIVNATGYGLTSGLESLDECEQEKWTDGIRAGNLYVNRVTTGAIVLRQPFGGMGKSAFGPGIKVGAPNYAIQFMDVSETAPPTGSANIMDRLQAKLVRDLHELKQSDSGIPENEINRTIVAISSYDLAYREEFSVLRDHFRLRGQDNIRRYLPAGRVRIRLSADDSFFDILARICAAKTARCSITVSIPLDTDIEHIDTIKYLVSGWGQTVTFVSESDDKLAELARAYRTDRIRYAAPDRVPMHVYEKCGAVPGVYISRERVMMEGHIEILWYVKEQSISNDYHRYGNLGARAGEERDRVY